MQIDADSMRHKLSTLVFPLGDLRMKIICCLKHAMPSNLQVPFGRTASHVFHQVCLKHGQL